MDNNREIEFDDQNKEIFKLLGYTEETMKQAMDEMAEVVRTRNTRDDIDRNNFLSTLAEDIEKASSKSKVLLKYLVYVFISQSQKRAEEEAESKARIH